MLSSMLTTKMYHFGMAWNTRKNSKETARMPEISRNKRQQRQTQHRISDVCYMYWIKAHNHTHAHTINQTVSTGNTDHHRKARTSTAGARYLCHCAGRNPWTIRPSGDGSPAPRAAIQVLQGCPVTRRWMILLGWFRSDEQFIYGDLWMGGLGSGRLTLLEDIGRMYKKKNNNNSNNNKDGDNNL